MLRAVKFTGPALIAAMALIVAGCGSSSKSSSSSSSSSSGSSGASTSGNSGSSSSASSGKHYTFALVPGDDTDPFYLTMRAGAEAEAKKLGGTVDWQGSPTFAPSDQIPVLQTLLAKKPSALIVAPTDPNAVTPTLKSFVSAGIPVVTADTEVADPSFITAQVTSDNTQGGAEAADACAKETHDAGQTAVIYTTAGTTTTNARGKGFIAEIKKKYPKMSVVATEFDNNDTTTATSQVSDLLLAHSGLNCIFGTNDYAAEGIARAVADQHKTSSVYVVGYDAEPLMINLLKKKEVQVVIAQRPAVEGQLAVEYAYDKLTGKTSAIKKTTQLSNITITDQNYNSPSIKKYIYQAN